MIKCNRCGNMSPAGPMCQSCGAPFSSKIDAGFSQRTGAQEQSELPAWLESLRVGERPAAPTGGPAKFSTADFIDEGPLPLWMRSERAETPDPSNVAMPEHLSAFPDQAPDRGNLPPTGLAAQSLIDEKSLPSWMKENKQPAPPPSGGFSASSLLQQESVPDWMKTLQPPSATPPPPPSFREQTGSFEQPVRNAESFSSNPAAGFSARDLIDQQALPSWMKPQGERNVPAPQTEPFMRPEPQGMPMNQSGLSASSLLDANSLPQWMREGGYNPGTKAEPSQPAWPTQNPPNPGWPAANTPPPAWSAGQTPSQPSLQANTPPAPGANMAASSFIDANALPEWLRNAADPRLQAGQDMSGGAKQASYTVPPRAENVRVPSRPRGNESGSSESEVAATVFASMLGVASTSPHFPGSQSSQEGSYQQPAPGRTLPTVRSDGAIRRAVKSTAEFWGRVGHGRWSIPIWLCWRSCQYAGYAELWK